MQCGASQQDASAASAAVAAGLAGQGYQISNSTDNSSASRVHLGQTSSSGDESSVGNTGSCRIIRRRSKSVLASSFCCCAAAPAAAAAKKRGVCKRNSSNKSSSGCFPAAASLIGCQQLEGLQPVVQLGGTLRGNSCTPGVQSEPLSAALKMPADIMQIGEQDGDAAASLYSWLLGDIQGQSAAAAAAAGAAPAGAPAPAAGLEGLTFVQPMQLSRQQQQQQQQELVAAIAERNAGVFTNNTQELAPQLSWCSPPISVPKQQHSNLQVDAMQHAQLAASPSAAACTDVWAACVPAVDQHAQLNADARLMPNPAAVMQPAVGQVLPQPMPYNQQQQQQQCHQHQLQQQQQQQQQHSDDTFDPLDAEILELVLLASLGEAQEQQQQQQQHAPQVPSSSYVMQQQQQAARVRSDPLLPQQQQVPWPQPQQQLLLHASLLASSSNAMPHAVQQSSSSLCYPLLIQQQQQQTVQQSPHTLFQQPSATGCGFSYSAVAAGPLVGNTRLGNTQGLLVNGQAAQLQPQWTGECIAAFRLL
jgi:hypothetical protein